MLKILRNIKNLFVHIRSSLKFIFLIIIAIIIIIGIISLVYRPMYSVTLNGEFIGYTTNKSKLQKRINEYIENENENNIAFIEAALDDPEHIEMNIYGFQLLDTVRDIKQRLNELIKSSENGRVIKEGIKTVILGKPNAGKSSFLNAILGEDRAIVTDIEGTTRDILEENVRIHGISLNIIDTAGIRNTDDVVEKIGVDKAKAMAKDADLIIYIVDTSRPFDSNDMEIIDFIKGRKCIILLNKTDLENGMNSEDLKILESIDKAYIVKISAKNQIGIDEFENKIKEMFFHGEVNFNDEVFITNARHRHSIAEALKSMEMVEQSIENNMPEDFFTIDLMNSYEALGSVIGEAVEDDLVDRIFSSFCMGK